MPYPLEHKIIKPFKYTKAIDTDIRDTFFKFAPHDQIKSAIIKLQYPLNGAK